jgi:hypothetical protein
MSQTTPTNEADVAKAKSPAPDVTQNPETEPVAQSTEEEGVKISDLQLDDGLSPEGKRLTFIYKLFQILEKEKCTDILAWLPHGKAFAIFDKRRFEAEIMPLVLESNAKYPSFIRRLLRWNFKQVNDCGTGLFANPHFQRGCPHLLRQLRSKESKLGKLEQRLMQQTALMQRPAAAVQDQLLFTDPTINATKDYIDLARKSTLERLHQLDVMSNQLEARRVNISSPNYMNFASGNNMSNMLSMNQNYMPTNRDIRSMLQNPLPSMGSSSMLGSGNLSRSNAKLNAYSIEKMRFIQAGLSSGSSRYSLESMKPNTLGKGLMGSGSQARNMAINSFARMSAMKSLAMLDE